MIQTVASAKFQYQLPEHEKGAEGKGERRKQRCPTLWQGSTSYPKCIHTWQLRCKCYLLISDVEKPQEHAMRKTGPTGWETHPIVRLLTHQPCYQFRIAISNQITFDSLSFVKNNSISMTPPLHPVLVKYLIFKSCSRILLHWLLQNPCGFCQGCISISI